MASRGNRRPRVSATAGAVPEMIRSVLWNTKAEALDAERDAHTLISSVLMHGLDPQVRWLFATYGKARIREWVIADSNTSRTLPMGDRRFWMLALAPEKWTLEEEQADIIERWRPRRMRPTGQIHPTV